MSLVVLLSVFSIGVAVPLRYPRTTIANLRRGRPQSSAEALRLSVTVMRRENSMLLWPAAAERAARWARDRRTTRAVHPVNQRRLRCRRLPCRGCPRTGRTERTQRTAHPGSTDRRQRREAYRSLGDERPASSHACCVICERDGSRSSSASEKTQAVRPGRLPPAATP